MKLDFDSARPLAFLDFETASEADLKGGLRKYMEHPTTRALTCCIRAEGLNILWSAGTLDTDAGRRDLLRAVEGRTVVAHNAPFDAAVWERVLGLPPVPWRDTLPMARAAGFPGSLDKLSLAVGGRGKDKNGGRLIDMLCILRPGRPRPSFGPAHDLLLDYNRQDVEELELVYSRVKGCGEPDVMTVDRSINDRGLPIDMDLLGKLDSMFAENALLRGAEFSGLTGINPKSPKQVLGWLAERGFQLDGVNKAALHKFLTVPEDYCTDDSDMSVAISAAREALTLRNELVGVGRGKIDAVKRMVDTDGRLRDQLVYYGAHTGRWTSRGLQLHNMPSVIKSVDVRNMTPEYSVIRKEAEEATARIGVQVSVSDILNLMLRRLLLADNFIVADYGAVEARCVAWMAGEYRMLELFADPEASVYIDMGTKVFGRRITKKGDPGEYSLAKALVLGCGYGMSGAKFTSTLHARWSKEDVALFERSNVNIAESVKTYRTSYPAIPALWREFHSAVHACVGEGREVRVGRCTFKPVGNDMHMVLPSGRPIVYRNARVEMQVPMYCRIYSMPEVPVPTVVFDNPRGAGFLFGSRAVENASQGICRDLLAAAVMKSMEDGLDVVLHVHDEIVGVASEDALDHLLRTMSIGPGWAEGFPLLVEGYSGPQWSKVSAGYTCKDMLSGELV
jgi:DNA polymerase bacteriophage-type